MADATMPGLPAVRNPLEAQPDLLRELVEQTVNALLSAEADALCGAPYGVRSEQRSNRRNGYRERRWDTRAGSIELQIPKLREGSYFPDWLLDRRRRAEKALISVVADLYLAGVSTRRVEKAIQTLGVESISKSQVSRLCSELDELVEAFRTRPLDGSPYPFVMLDALVVKVREAGRIVNVCVVHATGVNAAGYRESLGLDLVTAEDGAAWLAFLRGLVARGLSGVQLVTSDAHPGLVDAIRSTLPGAAWQRCRTHFMRNLLTRVPRSMHRGVATLVRTIFDQADAELVSQQFERTLAQLQPLTWERKVRDAIEEQLPEGEPSAERIAQALHLSLRSLQRHLADEGCRFDTLLNESRENLALLHLRDPHCSLSEVSYLLGFADTSSFSRAFKRWTGMTPGQFRDQLR